MKKLNELQVEMIKKMFGKVAYIVIHNVEKYGDDKNTLENNIDLAYDIMLQHAE
jgi:hypothetical protein